MARVVPLLADDRMCFACGSRNPRGLRLRFVLDERRRTIKTRWVPTKEFQGYADIVHGGMIALILDELMVNLLWTLKMPAVTAELNVRFHRPASVGQALECRAHLSAGESRLFRMKAEARTLDGKIVAGAAAKCIRVKAGD